MWFEQHLDDIIPMAFGPKDSDGRAVVAKVFCEGRGVAEVAQSIGKSPRTVYNYIDAFFDTLVDNLPDDVFNTLSRKAAGLQMWRHKACQKPGCGGDMYYDDVGGAQHPGSEWVCILCGCRVAHETRVTTPR